VLAGRHPGAIPADPQGAAFAVYVLALVAGRSEQEHAGPTEADRGRLEGQHRPSEVPGDRSRVAHVGYARPGDPCLAQGRYRREEVVERVHEHGVRYRTGRTSRAEAVVGYRHRAARHHLAVPWAVVAAT